MLACSILCGCVVKPKEGTRELEKLVDTNRAYQVMTSTGSSLLHIQADTDDITTLTCFSVCKTNMAKTCFLLLCVCVCVSVCVCVCVALSGVRGRQEIGEGNM